MSDKLVFRPEDIRVLDISQLQDLIVRGELVNGASFEATELRAIELVMSVKPSAFEGLRMHWPKFVWAFHNIVAHPLMHILVWMRCYKTAFWLHDYTVPRPLGKKAKRPAPK